MGNDVCCSKQQEQEEMNTKPEKILFENQENLEDKNPYFQTINYENNKINEKEVENLNHNININEDNDFSIRTNNIPKFQNKINLKNSYQKNYFNKENNDIPNVLFNNKKNRIINNNHQANNFEQSNILFSNYNEIQSYDNYNKSNNNFKSSTKGTTVNKSLVNNNNIFQYNNNKDFKIESSENYYNNIGENNTYDINNKAFFKTEVNSFINPSNINKNQTGIQLSSNIKNDDLFKTNNIDSYSYINSNNNIIENNNIITDLYRNPNIIKNDENVNQNNNINSEIKLQSNNIIENENVTTNINPNSNIEIINMQANGDMTKESTVVSKGGLFKNNNEIQNYNLMLNNYNTNLIQEDNIINNNENINNNIIENDIIEPKNEIIENNNDNYNSILKIENNNEPIYQKKEEHKPPLSFTPKQIEDIFKTAEKKSLMLEQNQQSNNIQNENEDNNYEKESVPLDTSYSEIKSEISYREISPLKKETYEEKPQFLENKINPEKVITKENALIEKTIVRKPIVQTTYSPKKYVETTSPEKTKVIYSTPKYSQDEIEYNNTINEDNFDKYNIKNYNNINNNNNIEYHDISNQISDYNKNSIIYNTNNTIKDNNIINNIFRISPNEIKESNYNQNQKIQTPKNKIIRDPNLKNVNNYNPIKNPNNQLYFSPKIESQRKKLELSCPIIDPSESINNYNYNYDSPVKNSKTYIQYNSPSSPKNLYSENICFSPSPETRHIIEHSPLKINKPIIQYTKVDKRANPIYSPTKIIKSNTTYTQFIDSPLTLNSSQYNQIQPITKIQKLNVNNQNDLYTLKKSKSYTNVSKVPIINYNYNNNLDSINNLNNISYINYTPINQVNNLATSTNSQNSIINQEHLNNIIKYNLMSQSNYQVNSFNSLSSHRSNLSYSSSSSKTRYDKFGNPVYTVLLNTPSKNKKMITNSRILYENKKLKSPEDNSGSEINSKHSSPSNSPIRSPEVVQNIRYDLNNLNNLNRSNYFQNQTPNLHVINPSNIEISQENRHIIDYYLNMNCKNKDTFSPNAFKYFYPNNEEYFIVPQNEIITNQDITYNVNNNQNLVHRYIGSINQFGLKHGYGTLITPTSQFIGTWRNGQFSGWGREIKNNGEVFEGKYNNGKINGKGIYKYRDILYIGDFENNIRQGKGEKICKYYYYKGEFKNDKIDGYGKIQFINSRDGKMEYEGFFKQNNIEGEGLMKWKNGNIYKGYMKNGKMNGYGTFIPYNGIPIKGCFVNGTRVDINANNNLSNNRKIENNDNKGN